MSFASWHDFFYMGGHYLYVWLSYGIGMGGIAMLLVRPVLTRRRLMAQLRQRERRPTQQRSTEEEVRGNASHSS